MHQHSHYRGPRGRRERTWENILRDNSWKLTEHGKGNSQPWLGSTESPRKDKLKEKHTETHSNQTDKKIKDRDKILKAAREKQQQITYKGTLIRLSADFSTETLQASRERHLFQVLKGKNLQPRTLYPPRLSFRFDGEIKSFPEKQKLREFITLQQMLKELF